MDIYGYIPYLNREDDDELWRFSDKPVAKNWL